MLKVPLEMPAPAAVPSVQIIRAVLREYHPATHTAEVEPVLGPASLVGEIPVLMSCRPDLLTAGRELAVLTWSDVGGLVLGPYGAVPGDPPNADDADTVDSIHAASTATANKLLALNGDAKLAASITGDADTVDGFHAAGSPTASKLLAMDASAKFPGHTVAGDLTVDGILSAYSSLLKTVARYTGNTRQKVKITWSGAATLPHASAVYLVSMGFRGSAGNSGYGIGLFCCVKEYNNRFVVGWTQLLDIGGKGTITKTEITNTSTELDVELTHLAGGTNEFGAYSVLRVGTGYGRWDAGASVTITAA